MSSQKTIELIKACISGDALAQKHLYETNKRKMFGVCLHYSSSREEAKDMLQEGFLRIFKDLPSYNGKGNFEGWMRRVVVHSAIDFLRKQKMKLVDFEGNKHESKNSYEMDTSAFFGQNDTPGALVKLMHQLPKGFRTVLNLYVIEGYSHDEIANLLNISTGTSKSQLSRAKEQMRTLLKEKLTR